MTETTGTMTTEEVTAMISRLCIGVDVIATVFGKDEDSNKQPTHKPKGKWRFGEI